MDAIISDIPFGFNYKGDMEKMYPIWIKEMIRVLKVGGVISILTTNEYSLMDKVVKGLKENLNLCKVIELSLGEMTACLYHFEKIQFHESLPNRNPSKANTLKRKHEHK